MTTLLINETDEDLFSDCLTDGDPTTAEVNEALRTGFATITADLERFADTDDLGDALETVFPAPTTPEPVAEPESQPEPAPVANSTARATELAPVLPDFDTLAAGEQVAANTVVLEMHINRAGVRRSFDARELLPKRTETILCDKCDGDAVNVTTCETCQGTGKVSVEVDPNFFYTAKDILDKSYLKPINKRLLQLVKYRSAHTVPASMLKNGWYILPKEFIDDMYEQIESCKTDVEALLDKLEPHWPEMIEKARPKLGPHFKLSDYPTFSAWRSEYQITYRYRGLNVPALLSEYNQRLAQQEFEKVKLEWADTAQEVRDAMRGGFTYLVKKFADGLGRDDDGKFKTFHKSIIEKLREFCATFAARDLTGDEQLAQLAGQVKQLVEGVDPKALRKDEALRGALELGFKQIADEASKLVVVRERTVSFDEDEDF
jgi:hypothetical protein